MAGKPTLLAALALAASVVPGTADEPLRIGIAGMSHGHVAGLLAAARDRADLQIVGVWETDARLFDRLADAYGLDASLRHDELGEMLDACKPEAVSGMGSIRSHRKVVEACAPRRIPVLLEKPLAFSIEDADRCVELSEQYGTPILTNYETSWYASVHEAERIARSGEYGDIIRMVFRHGHRGPWEIGCSSEFLRWLTDPKENGGGAVIDFGCYGAVIATRLMDGQKPESVQAVRRQIKTGIYPDVDDDATILLAYPHTTAVIEASWNWPHDLKEMDIYLSGASLHAGKWDALSLRKSGEAEATPLAPPPVRPFGDEWSYLKAVAHDGAEIEPLSSLPVNHTVVWILDQARKVPMK
ncbi:Gfo/Idh/MocA family protein [Haloferula sargassicola]